MSRGRSTSLLSTALVVVLTASAASATIFTVDWMKLEPTPFGASPASVAAYSLPGVGTVQVSYTPSDLFGQARVQNPALAAGSLDAGGDTYNWTNHETLGRTHTWSSDVLISSWQVTYTFDHTIPAGQLILGIQGLGRRSPSDAETAADCRTTASVLQNGEYLGDWKGGQNYASTSFSDGLGSFSMINSLTGPGEANPWWNSGLALVRIDDAVDSLTVEFDQTRGDGIGVNIGVLLPEPCSLLLLTLGGPAVLRRRSRPARALQTR